MEELVDDLFAVVESVIAFFITTQFGFSDLFFNLVQASDVGEELGYDLWLLIFCLDKLATAVHPTLGMSNTFVFFRIASIGHVAVTQQGTGKLLAQHALDMLAPTADGVGEDYLVLLTVQGPEVNGTKLRHNSLI